VRRVIEVNLLGTLNCGLQTLPALRNRGHGTIVNTSSGTIAGFRLLSAYSASRGATTTLTFSWGMEVAGTGVRVNAIAPSGATRLDQHFARYYGEPIPPEPPRPRSHHDDPLWNNGVVVAYLLSGVSAPLNGQVVRVQRDEIGLITHPTILDPTGRRDRWSVAEVASWFDATGDDARPLGLAHAREILDAEGFTLSERPPRRGPGGA
jgi:short chain dehydrogenase